MDAIIHLLRHAPVAQEDSQQFARHVERKGIDTEDVEEFGGRWKVEGGRRSATQINDVHEQCLEEGGEATGHEDVTGTPDALIERQTVGEQIAADDEYRTEHEDGDDLLLDSLTLTDESAAIEAKQHMGDGGDGAQQSLGIDRTFVINVVVAQHLQIELRQNIRIGIVGIAVAEDQYGGIESQQHDDDGDRVAVVAIDGEERHGEVAEGDTLQDGHDAEVTQPVVAIEGAVEPVYGQADDEEQHRTLQDAAEHGPRGFELGLHQREVAGDTHDEEEEREHEVAGRHAVPLRMLKHLEGLAPAVVDEDHACHGDAAEDVEGEKALTLFHFTLNIDY